MSVMVRYRNPRSPDEAGLTIICDRFQIAEVEADLKRRGMIIVMEESADQAQPSRRAQ